MRKALIGVVLCLVARAAAAEDLEDKGFGLRFSAALGRFARYPDTAALGGAGGGSPWSSSPNPASCGMNPATGPKGFGASAQYALVLFDEGTDVHIGSVSGSYRSAHLGTFQPSIVAATTNDAETTEGLTFHWEAIGGELQWGRMVSCDTSFGVNLSVLGSKISQDLGTIPAYDSDSTTFTGRIGVLHRFTERCFAGIAAEVSVAPSDTTLHDLLTGGSGDVLVEDTTYSFVLRPGVYTKITKDLSAYLDAVICHYADDTGTLLSYRIAGGLDQTIIKGLYARAGAVLDGWGNVSITAGIGLAPSESFMVDISYSYNLFPEIEKEFGKSHVFGAGVTLLF